MYFCPPLQQFYQDAVCKKAHTWKLMANLRSERILNGVENLDSLSASLSQSLWSINSLSSAKKGDQDRSSTPSLFQQHQVLNETASNDQSYISTKGRAPKMSKYKNFRSFTGSMDLSNSLNLQRTTSLGGIKHKPTISPINGLRRNDISSNSTTVNLSKSANFIRTPRGNVGGNHMYSPYPDRTYSRDMIQQNIAEKSPISDASSTEESDFSLWDVSRRRTRNVFLSNDLSASLPRPNRAKKLPLTKSLSHSPVNFNESTDYDDLSLSMKDLNPQSLTDSSKALPSALNMPLKNTKEDLVSQKFRDMEWQIPSQHSPAVLSQSPNSHKPSSITRDLGTVQPESVVSRKKCHSLGSLDTPDINKLLQHQEMFNTSRKKSLPCAIEDSKKNIIARNLCSSEGSLWEPLSSDSCYNVVYTYSRSQKPNVETVSEEEESTKNKHESRENEVAEITDISMASSTCTEVPLQKSSEKLDSETEHVLTSDESDNDETQSRLYGKEKKEEEGRSSEEKNAQGNLKCEKHEEVHEVSEAIAVNIPQFRWNAKLASTGEINEVEKTSSKAISESIEKTRLENKSCELLKFKESDHISKKTTEPSEISEIRRSESDLGHSFCSERELEYSFQSNGNTSDTNCERAIGECDDFRSKEVEGDKVTNASCLGHKKLSLVHDKFQKSDLSDRSKFNIPEMAISDVDSAKPELLAQGSRVEYIFKDTSERITSFSETDSDFEIDQTPREKFMLLHEWRTFESVSVESDDLSSPGSVNELKFAITGKKGLKKVDTPGTLSPDDPVSLDNGKKILGDPLNQEPISAIASARSADNTSSSTSARSGTPCACGLSNTDSSSHGTALIHSSVNDASTSSTSSTIAVCSPITPNTTARDDDTGSDIVVGVTANSSDTPPTSNSTSSCCSSGNANISTNTNIGTSASGTSDRDTSNYRNPLPNGTSTDNDTPGCNTANSHDIPAFCSQTSSNISACDTSKQKDARFCGISTNSGTSEGSTSISTNKRIASYSPVMKKRTVTSCNAKKQEKLEDDAEEDPNPKSKVKQLSQMFEGRQRTPKESTSRACNASPSHRLEAMKKVSCSPTMRAKLKSLESNAQQATSKSRKQPNSKIPTAGDKKTRALNGQVRKETFKSPDPLGCTDRLLPPKPTYRNRQPRTSGRSTKQASTESAKLQSEARYAFRSSSAPIRTKINDLAESPVQKRKLDCSQDLGTNSHKVQELKSPESPKRRVRSQIQKEYSFMEATCEVRSDDIKTSSTNKETEQENHVDLYGVEESKSKPASTSVVSPKNRMSVVQAPKPLPRKKLELKGSNGGESQVPQPKPRNGAGFKTNPSPQWDLFRRPVSLQHRVRPASGLFRPPGTSQSFQKQNSNRFSNRHTNTKGSCSNEAASKTNNNATDWQQVAELTTTSALPCETPQASTARHPDSPVLVPRRRLSVASPDKPLSSTTTILLQPSSPQCHQKNLVEIDQL